MSPALRIKLFFALAALCLASAVRAQGGAYAVSGRVIDRLTRRPVAYAAVVPVGQEQRGASTDSLGRFRLERVQAGIFRLSASSVGYKTVVTPEYLVSAATPFIEIEMEEDATQLEAVTVVPSPFRATAESPVGLQVIGVREIEKSPGANRDVSRIVRSYPGVSFSPVGYRNDLIVRGGGPSENKFYLDGIEIPNINHFATQGATGGPVSILNADLIREINFYTGAFPADRSGALSSVLDIRLRDGNPEKQTFKATLGASEVSLSGSGHIGEKTSYLFSLRQSYLQLLFKMIGLPFLPNYIDGQLKVKTRLSEHDELTVLGLAGFDNMKLNLDEEGEDAEYLLSYLPRIRQETFTVGAAWRHYAGRHVQTVSLGHTYLNNRNLKYRGNDDSSEDNLTLRLRSVEQKTTLRAENRSYLGRWTVREGAELSYSGYTNRTEQRLFTDEAVLSDYRTRLGIVGWGLFAGADYASADKRFTASVGVRADGADYSARMAKFWRQLSPRASVSYQLGKGWSLSGSRALLPVAALYGPGVQAGRGAGERGVGLPARGNDQRRRRMAPARPPGRLGRGVLQEIREYPAFRLGRHPALVQRRRLWRGWQRSAAPDGRRAVVRGRGDGTLADTREGQPRRFGDPVPQRVPCRCRIGVYRIGLGQPFRGEPQRHVRPAAQLERRGAPERRGRDALYALRCRKIVAGRSLGRPGAPVL